MASRRRSASHALPTPDAAPPQKRRGRKPKEFAQDATPALASACESKVAAPPYKSPILTGPAPAQLGELYFTAHDRLLYENRQYAMKNAAQALALKRLEIVQAKIAAEKEIRKLEGELLTITSQFKELEKALFVLQEDIETTYRVKLKHVVYDSETGRITLQPN